MSLLTMAHMSCRDLWLLPYALYVLQSPIQDTTPHLLVLSL